MPGENKSEVWRAGSSLQSSFVASLPNFGERDGRVEPVEDAQRQSDALDDGPSEEAVELQLHRVGLHFLGLEGVDHPHGHVADQQEGHDLSAGLRAVMFWEMDASAGYVRDEEKLQYHLSDGQQSSDHYQEVRFMSECIQSSSDNAEHSVDKQPKCWDAQQDIVQVALLLSAEFHSLDPYKPDDYSNNTQYHKCAMGHIGQINGQYTEIRMMNQYEE